MRRKLEALLRWCLNRVPEALLVLFVLGLVPLVALAGLSLFMQAKAFVGGPGGYLKQVWMAPLGAASTAVCLGGAALLVYLLLANWTPIWAVARKMIIEALHRRVVLVLLVFVVVMTPLLPFILKTEGSLKSQVQLVLLYSLVLSMVLLSLLAIFAATASICSEVERKHVHITDTKPLRRWHFIMGKWFGLVVMCGLALFAMTGATYGLVHWLARPRDLSHLPPEEAAKVRSDRRKLLTEVFVARRLFGPPMPDVTAEVEKKVAAWRKTTMRTDAVHSYRKRATRECLWQSQTVNPGQTIIWQYTGLNPAPPKGERISVRFKAFASGKRTLFGYWMVLNVRQEARGEGGQTAPVLRPVAPPAYPPPQGWTSGTFHEVNFDARCVAPDGSLLVSYTNDGEMTSVTFDIDDPVHVLQREPGFVGGFAPNYYRATMVLLFHIALLAALGLMAGALFSFPVASLVVSALFVGGLLAPWFYANFVVPDIYAQLGTPLEEQLDAIWRGFATVVTSVLPNFGSFSPLDKVVNGRLVAMLDLSAAGAALLFLKAGAALLIGMYFYGRRELARVIV